MTKSQHTKTPWKGCKPRLVESSVYKANIHHTNAELFSAPAAAYGGTPEQAEANAAFIVKAVNAHDDLVKALEAFVGAWISGDGGAVTAERLSEAYDLAVPALAKAKGE